MTTVQLAQRGIDEDTLVGLLGMKATTLLHHDYADTCADRQHGKGKADDETSERIDQHKAKDADGSSNRRPGDVPSLQSHELQRALKPLEHGIVRVVVCFLCHSRLVISS